MDSMHSHPGFWAVTSFTNQFQDKERRVAMKLSSTQRDAESRRSKPKSAVLVAGLASLSLFLAACSGSATNEGSGGSSSSGGSGSSGEIRNAGVIVHAQNGEPASL